MTLTLVKPATDLIAEINDAYHQAEHALRNALDHALHCGELLHEAKLGLDHGDWTGWLSENFAGSQRTANQYAQLAQAQRTDPALLDSLPERTITAAVKAIARPAASPAPRSEPASPEPEETYVLTIEQLSELVRSFGGRADPEHVRRWIERLSEPKMGLCPHCGAAIIHAVVNGRAVIADRYEWQPRATCTKCLQTRHAHPGRPVSCPHCNSTGFTGIAKRPSGRMLAMDMAWADTPSVRVIGERTDRRTGEALHPLHVCRKAEAA